MQHRRRLAQQRQRLESEVKPRLRDQPPNEKERWVALRHAVRAAQLPDRPNVNPIVECGHAVRPIPERRIGSKRFNLSICVKQNRIN